MEWHERVQEIEAFLNYAREEWPKARPSVAARLPRRCSRCILSERCGPLEGGLCAACRSAAAAPASQPAPARDFRAAQEQLHRLFTEHQGRGRGRYDALVMYSGGKDSTLLLHKLTAEYPGLRLLALLVDNGFLSRVALRNAGRTFAKLDVDHTVFRPKFSLFAKTFRHALTHRSKDDPYPLVDRLDGELTFDIGRNLAASLEIPLMLVGLSGEQVEGILRLSTFESPAAWEEGKDTPKEFGLEPLYTPNERNYWWRAASWPAERRPRVIYPFYAWQLGEQHIRAEVVRLGLVEAGNDHPLVTNSDLVPVLMAADLSSVGYSGFEPGFAQLVREGKASRQEWLNFFEAAHYLASKGQFLPRSIADTLGRLGLTGEALGLAGA
jgi:hypothetical protein